MTPALQAASLLSEPPGLPSQGITWLEFKTVFPRSSSGLRGHRAKRWSLPGGFQGLSSMGPQSTLHSRASACPPPLPSFSMRAGCPLCVGTCLGCSSAWLWPGPARFRRETSGLRGPPLLIRHGPCLHDTSPRGRHSSGSDGQTRGMIYNLFQGIIAANGQPRFALPQGGRAKSINGESNVARPAGRVWPDIRR